jgi:hypothetical protein
MIKLNLFASLVWLLLWQTESMAANPDQLAAIRGLGSLNGIALHCNGLAETQKIKRILVQTLPKRRQLGELFDYETNNAFLAFIEHNSQCPSPQSLSRQVDEALTRLKAAYTSQ